jgi:hypothetical protein
MTPSLHFWLSIFFNFQTCSLEASHWLGIQKLSSKTVSNRLAGPNFCIILSITGSSDKLSIRIIIKKCYKKGAKIKTSLLVKFCFHNFSAKKSSKLENSCPYPT